MNRTFERQEPVTRENNSSSKGEMPSHQENIKSGETKQESQAKIRPSVSTPFTFSASSSRHSPPPNGEERKIDQQQDGPVNCATFLCAGEEARINGRGCGAISGAFVMGF